MQVRRDHELDPVPSTRNVHNALQDRGVDHWLRGQAIGASQRHPFFHWPLEFPDVFEQGGFDVVLGNPPWDQVQPEEVKFFGIHAPDIADLPGARRKAAISELPSNDPELGVSMGVTQALNRGTE